MTNRVWLFITDCCMNQTIVETPFANLGKQNRLQWLQYYDIQVEFCNRANETVPDSVSSLEKLLATPAPKESRSVQKWLALEVILPCVLVGLLALLNRLIDSHTTSTDACYSNSVRAMPSAGVWQFLQTAKTRPDCRASIGENDDINLRTRLLPSLDDALQNIAESNLATSSEQSVGDSLKLLLQAASILFARPLNIINNKRDYYNAFKPYKYGHRMQTLLEASTSRGDGSTTNEPILQCGESQFSRRKYRLCEAYFRSQYLYGLPSVICESAAGYILVTPDTPYTRNVVHMINRKLKLFNQTYEFFYILETLTSHLNDQEIIIKLFHEFGVSKSDLRNWLTRNTFGNFNINHFTSFLQIFNFENRFVFVKNEEELVTIGSCLQDNNIFLAGIVFNTAEDDSMPKITKYKIQMANYLVDSPSHVGLATWSYDDDAYAQWPDYVQLGFTVIQETIDRAIIEVQTGVNPNVGVYFQPFPRPCYRSRLAISIMAHITPTLIILSWSFLSAMIIKNVVVEKESGLKEYMKVMGLGTWPHWISWFIQYSILMAITAFLFTLILKLGKMFPMSNVIALYIFILVFGMATITQSFMVSTWFSSANKAAVLGGLLYAATTIPGLILLSQATLTDSNKRLWCLISQVALGLGLTHMGSWEQEGSGLQWSNMNRGPTLINNFAFWNVIGMLLIDTILYFLAALYFEAVFPAERIAGEYGLSKPWYFPFTPSFWFDVFGYKQKQEAMPTTRHTSTIRQQQNLEGDPDLPIGVNLSELRKVYSNGNVAVDKLTIKFYESQITALLGHNGAGKTTTMSILTGIFGQSGGTAKVYGLDTKSNIAEIRKSLGMCPQHNMLYERLTVKQQVTFCAGLRGVDRQSIEEEVVQLISDVGLEEKSYEYVSTLSGGMKRKLSIALALLGNTKTVILDEPTAGVDPSARRGIWDMLTKYKSGRTIILSTHHMDEADVLGDRIAIIANGRLITCGSSIFLKSKFGKGCQLGLSLTAESTRQMSNEITELVKYHFGTSATTEKISNQEAIYTLPRDKPEVMGTLLNQLEAEKMELHIESMSVQDTTMEDIFLNVNSLSSTKTEFQMKNVFEQLFDYMRKYIPGVKLPANYIEMDEVELDTNNSNDIQLESECINSTSQEHPSFEPQVGLFLQLHHTKALLYKRFHNFRRNFRGAIVEIIVPIGLLFMACLSMNSQSGSTRYEFTHAKVLDHWMYETTSVPNKIFIELSSNAKTDVPRKSILQLLEAPGPGIRCTEGTQKISCIQPAKKWENEGKYIDYNKTSCGCGPPECPSYRAAKQIQLETTDIIVNITGSNIEEYIVKTTDDQHRATYAERLAGFSIASVNTFAVDSKEVKKISKLVAGALKNVAKTTTLNRSAKDIENILQTLDAQSNIKIWYNPNSYLAPPAYLNVLNNALMRYNLPASKPANEYGIEVSTQPLPLTDKQRAYFINQAKSVAQDGQKEISAAFLLLLIFSVIPASLVVFTVTERVSQAKHLQIVSGVSPATYWMSNFIWDMINMQVPISMTIMLFLIFDLNAYAFDVTTVFSVWLLFLIYSSSILVTFYALSFMFKVASFAVVVLTTLNFFAGLFMGLYNISEQVNGRNSFINFLLNMFPSTSLFSGLFTLISRKAIRDMMKAQKNIIEGLQQQYLAMCIMFCVASTILMIIEYWRRVYSSTVRQSSTGPFQLQADTNVDQEVAQEQEFVINASRRDFALKFNGLTKVYTKRSCLGCATGTILAVDRLCLGIRKGECFGLVGLNGAGKTSTFKMLTGEETITAGFASCDGFDVVENPDKSHRSMGYCPQFNALNDYLTAREHLALFARLRGVKETAVKNVVDWAIEHMNLSAHQRVIAKRFSGGNKRKLSTAIALVGKPNVLLLDEPSAGIDPKARRFLWNRILDVVKEGRSVVLTTHSMEECEALCSRVSIMVEGKLKCIGTIQHLKNKFSEGYRVGLQLRSSEPVALEAASQRVGVLLPLATVTGRHGNQLQFHVQISDDLTLPKLFGAIHRLSVEMDLQDYSVRQTSLDDVFVRFARQSRNATQVNLAFRQEQP